jgi:hypothetical protein
VSPSCRQLCLVMSDEAVLEVREIHTALLSYRHFLSFGQLDELHAEDVHEVTLGLREYILEQASM